jgi:crotonobetainyl-CoA:carnitine CoA-transferase CaiB-like acyl-CoA transferase
MYKPLDQVRVLDCTRLLPYQYCTMLLGDLGAEVLKIEEPREGDYGRWGDSERSYESTAFVMANRNKRSMKLNLKDERGREIFMRLAGLHDVVVESYRPGVMERLGLDYREIVKVNPRIIYCSATGYGQTGPYANKAGHDINYLSYSGILASTGEHTGRPVIPGIPFGDMAGGGVFTALLIIAALHGRQQSGKGQYIDTAQTDIMTSLNLLNLADTVSRSMGRKARPHDLRGGNLCYNIYRTSDGKFVALGALERKFWIHFCKAVGKQEWIQNHLLPYEEGTVATDDLIRLFASKTQEEWIAILGEEDVCFSPVLRPEEVFRDAHLRERGMITVMPDPDRGDTVQLGFPAHFGEALEEKRRPAPYFGQDTDDVLAALGYQPGQVEDLRRSGVI